jgi:hypothetical protein
MKNQADCKLSAEVQGQKMTYIRLLSENETEVP